MTVRLQDLPHDVNELKGLWTVLEAEAEHSFFISWAWIHTWLACMRKENIAPKLLIIEQNGRAIAAGLLVYCKPRRHYLWSPRTWVLNATGDEALDTVFVEYNGLLAVRGFENAAWREWAEYLERVESTWDEVRLDGVPPSVLTHWKREGVALRDETPRTGRYVDLEPIRAAGKAFGEQLSKNTVRKVRQTRTAFEKLGAITTRVALNSGEARQFFNEMKTLHESRWQAIGGGRGAFTHPMFERFHTELIAKHFDSGCLQLFKASAGETTVGILYNFVYHGQVLQYQSGLNYALIARNESPGLLTHALSVDYNVAQGMSRYDLLVGDSQYKRSLAPNAYELWWGVIQQDRYKFRAEELLRRGVRGARAMLNRRMSSPGDSDDQRVERDAALS